MSEFEDFLDVDMDLDVLENQIRGLALQHRMFNDYLILRLLNGQNDFGRRLNLSYTVEYGDLTPVVWPVN